MQVEDLALELSRLTLDRILDETSDLPTMPQATLAVMRESQSSTSTAHSVAKYLAQDQALTARVLRLANSAFYGMQRQIATPEEAVVILGMRAVRNLALIASTYNWMAKAMGSYTYEPQEFWEHSLSTAVAAQVISSKVSPGSSDVAFTCGLLHDIGKAALNAWFENHPINLMAVANTLSVPVERAEKRILGFDHQEVGAGMAERWNLPKVIVESIACHHSPSDCFPHNPINDIVHVADYMSSTGHIGTGGGGVRFSLDPAALARLELTEENLAELSEEFEEVYERYDKLFEEKEAA